MRGRGRGRGQQQLGEGRGRGEGRAVREHERLLQDAASRGAELGRVQVHAEPGRPCGGRVVSEGGALGPPPGPAHPGTPPAHRGSLAGPRPPAARRPPPAAAAPRHGCAPRPARAARAPAAAPGPAPRCLRREAGGSAGTRHSRGSPGGKAGLPGTPRSPSLGARSSSCRRARGSSCRRCSGVPPHRARARPGSTPCPASIRSKRARAEPSSSAAATRAAPASCVSASPLSHSRAAPAGGGPVRTRGQALREAPPRPHPLTELRDQDPQVRRARAVQAQERLFHLQGVAHTAAQRTVHGRERGRDPQPQACPDAHLREQGTRCVLTRGSEASGQARACPLLCLVPRSRLGDWGAQGGAGPRGCGVGGSVDGLECPVSSGVGGHPEGGPRAGMGPHQRLRQLPGLGLVGEERGPSKLHVHHQRRQLLHHLLAEDGGCSVREAARESWSGLVLPARSVMRGLNIVPCDNDRSRDDIRDRVRQGPGHL